jgi:hypothetical protein
MDMAHELQYMQVPPAEAYRSMAQIMFVGVPTDKGIYVFRWAVGIATQRFPLTNIR